MNRKKIAICGTPEFCLPFFQAILEGDAFEIKCAITQIAKPSDRGQKIKQTPVAIWAKQNKIECFEIARIKDFEATPILEEILQEIDCVLLFAFGKIIPKKWLDLPKHGWANIHPSKLPILRGPSPIQYCFLNGHESSALTLMHMNEKMDEGNLIAQKDFKIKKYHNKNSIMNELCAWGPKWISENLIKFLNGNIQPTPQSGGATYSYTISKQEHRVDFNQHTASEIERKTRGLGFVIFEHPKFGLMKCFHIECAMPESCSSESSFCEDVFLENSSPGEIDSYGRIKCKEGTITPIYIQRPGKRIMHYRCLAH